MILGWQLCYLWFLLWSSRALKVVGHDESVMGSAGSSRSKVVPSVPWHDDVDHPTSSSNRMMTLRDQYLRLEIPHYVFAPSGRLYTIETIAGEAMEQDENSNTVVVLQVKDGIVIVATVPSSPYMKRYDDDETETKEENTNNYHDKENEEENNDDDFLLWLSEEEVGISPTVSAPFLRIAGSEDRLLAVTAGNPLESQILRARMAEIAQNVHDEIGAGPHHHHHHHQNHPEDEIENAQEFIEIASRQLADDNQIRTQQFQHGKVLAATMILMSSNNAGNAGIIYRIDPTGQFFKCQAVVAGRCASQLETWLHKQLLLVHKSQTTKNDSATVVRDVLANQLSLERALVLARDCILQIPTQSDSSAQVSSRDVDGNTFPKKRTKNPKLRLRGIVMPNHRTRRMQCYTSREMYALRF